jgi:hypothetical protein
MGPDGPYAADFPMRGAEPDYPLSAPSQIDFTLP